MTLITRKEAKWRNDGYLIDEHGEVLASPEQLEDMGIKQQFSVHDEETLNKYLRIRHSIIKEIATLKEQKEKQIKEREANLKKLDFLFQAQAQPVIEKLLPYGKKSLHTDWFDCGWRTIPGGYIIEDEDKLQEWCASLPAETKKELGVTPKPIEYTRNLKLIKELAEAKHEIPGIAYKNPIEQFFID